MINEKNIKITELLDDRIRMNLNPELFRLVLQNLIGNSLKYGKDGGSILVRLFEKGSQIILEISDDGIGISEKDLPHIWERFYRSDQVRSTEGNGIGLALVKEIVEYHGGSITAVSSPGKGSRFTACFPIR